MPETHIITGLPRSGSTLLSAILRQNPAIQAGMTSPLHALLQNTIHATSNDQIRNMLDKDVRDSIVHAVFNCYRDSHPQDVLFDTNRSWSGNLALAEKLFPGFKCIVTVRNPAWVFDSLERITAKDPLSLSKIFAGIPTMTQRCSTAISGSGIIGMALEMVLSCLHSPFSDRVMVIDYDSLCANPDKIISAIYDFVDLEPFDHDLTNVEYTADKFDEALNLPDLHKVSGPVLATQRETCLPPKMFGRLSHLDCWTNCSDTNATMYLGDKHV
ncbi:MAG: sulfotransferase family protein [Halocynthiibacter sp.]